MNNIIPSIGKAIFSLRLLLIVMCTVLCYDLFLFALNFLKDDLPEFSKGLLGWVPEMTTERIIEPVDTLMIGNLVVMIVIGSWHIFIQKITFIAKELRPQWLDHINSGGLKVKICMSLGGVACVKLLECFLKTEDVGIKIVITLIFLVAAYVFAKTDAVLHPPSLENQTSNNNPSNTAKNNEEKSH